MSYTSCAMLKIFLVATFILAASAGNFKKEVDITWGNGRGKILHGGHILALKLDNYSGSGFDSKREYLFGRFDVQLKLIPGNSAGTVTTFFMTSQGPNHDEIDFEFLGNSSGQPYTVHTNVYAQGKGNREQQFRLWFDPTRHYHLYSIVWNPLRIIFLVDNIPIRVFKNNEASGVPFPTSQPMEVHGSLWNADDWATQGGRVKTDWSKAPFTTYYRNVNFNGNACTSVNGSLPKACAPTDPSNTHWRTQNIDARGRNRLRWVQQRYMIYNYCTDFNRFPQGVPPECNLKMF